MEPAWQTPRVALLWMLVSVSVAIFTHMAHLPLWVAGGGFVAIVWQIQVYRGVWAHPRALHKFLLAVLCFGGVMTSYRTLLGLEPMVALLMSGFVLKLLEIRRRRDALVLIYLAFFVVVVQCLFEQTMWTAATMFGGLVLVTAALVGLYQHGEPSSWWRPLGKSSVLLAQSLPLMLVMFLVMPRIGSLWAVPQQRQSGTIGVSDSMSPGDFSDLGRSGKVAFRVAFDGPIPAQRALYWRGLVFSNFDGRKWTQTGPWGYSNGGMLQWHGALPEAWDSVIDRRGQALAYTVTMKPSNNLWLFALATPVPRSPGVALTRDFRLYSRDPVTYERQYRAESWLDYRHETKGLSHWRRNIELALPEGYNPRTLAIARQWRLETPDPALLVNRLLGLFNENFYYTLKPPKLGKHTVDEFLWDTRRGFCEFYASSFVFFMRAAGVPARVVAGYQGGERHPSGDYLLVHQYDAHAWAEVWLDGRGWVRVDPTAAVAPERIEYSFADMFAEADGFLGEALFTLERFRHIHWLNKLRLRLDALEYAWAKWVLGYENVQAGLLIRLLGGVDPLRIGLFLLVASALAMLPVVYMAYRGREKVYRDELDQQFLRFCLRMESAGLPRQPGETPRQFATRVRTLRPELAAEVSELMALFERLRYQTPDPDAGIFEKRLRRFRPSFKAL